MNKKVFTGKTEDDAMNKAMIELQEKKDQLIICNVNKQTGGLFKASKVEIEITTKHDIVDYIKSLIKNITKKMGIDVQLEVKYFNEVPFFTLYSDQDAILIGKNGRTLSSLMIIIRQSVLNLTNSYFQFQLDVADYKKKHEEKLVRLAKKVAREVIQSKVPVKLEAMNSYERRIIHTTLVDFTNITTCSEGEEPNRCVVIKPVEEEI